MAEVVDSLLIGLTLICVVLFDLSEVVHEDDLPEGFFFGSKLHSEFTFPLFKLPFWTVLQVDEGK